MRCWDYTLIGEKILAEADERIKNSGDVEINLPPPSWPITEEEKKAAPIELFDADEGRVIIDDDDENYEEQIVLTSEMTDIDIRNNRIDQEAEDFGDAEEKRYHSDDDDDDDGNITETEEETKINDKENIIVNNSSTRASRSFSNLQRQFEANSSKKPRTTTRTSGRENRGRRNDDVVPYVTDYEEWENYDAANYK